MVTKKHAPKKTPRTRRGPAPSKRGPSIWERIEELGKSIPPEELANFPTDGARNLDHYLYGAPKQDPD